MRFAFLDAARSLAMAVLVFDHAVIAMHLFRVLPAGVKLVCFAATPIFVMHFGLMLELVYARRWRELGPRAVTRAFWLRAAQCYLGYVVVLVTAVVSGRFPWSDLPRGLIFLGQPWFSDILKFYSLFLLFAPLVLFLRVRFGVAAAFLALAAPWGLTPFLTAFSWPGIGSPYAAWTALLVGMPRGYTIPLCFLKGMIFVGIGLVLGNALRRGRYFLGTALSFASLAFALLASLVTEMHWDPFWRELLSGRLRFSSHPAYYAFAVMEGTLLFAALFLCLPPERSAPTWLRPLTAYSRWPLLSFTFANALATLFPVVRRAQGWEIPAALAFAVAMPVAVALWDRSRARPAVTASAGSSSESSSSRHS